MNNKIKSFISDSIIFGLFSIISRLLSFLLTPIYSNFLTVSNFDFLIVIISASSILVCIFSFGMYTTYLRFYQKDDSETSGQAFTAAYAVINVISLFFTFLIIIFSNQITDLSGFTHIPNASTIIASAALIPFLDVLTYIPFSHLRITGNTKTLVTIKLLILILTLVLHYIFIIQLNFQIEAVIYIYILANLLTFIFLIPEILKNINFSINKALAADMLKFAIPIIPALLIEGLLNNIDKLLLKYLLDSPQLLSSYYVNFRLALPMLIIVVIFEFSWQPFYLKNYTEKDSNLLFGRVITYFLLGLSLIFLIITMFLEYIMDIPFPGGRLINPIYRDNSNIITIILLAYIFYGFYIVFIASAVINKKTATISIALGIALIVSVTSNYILTPAIGVQGTALSILLAYSSAIIAVYFLNSNNYIIKYEKLRLFEIVSVSALLYFINYVLDKTIDYGTNLFLMKTALLAVYFIILKILGFFTLNEINFIKKFLRLN